MRKCLIVASFCQNVAGSTLTPLGPRISKALGPFLLVTSEDTLSLVLEALSVVVEIEGEWMTPDLANDIVGAVLDVWMKNIKGKILRPREISLTDCVQIRSLFPSLEMFWRHSLHVHPRAFTRSSSKGRYPRFHMLWTLRNRKSRGLQALRLSCWADSWRVLIARRAWETGSLLPSVHRCLNVSEPRRTGMFCR